MTSGSGHGSAGDAVAELVAVMDRLRSECAWKAAQTHESLLRFLVEEAYEVVDAVETGSAADLREELGDLLLQVVFHARVAEEGPEGRTPFELGDVARDITAKLRRRNPHVFDAEDDAVADLPPIDRDDADAVNERWEQMKAQEKSRTHLMDGVPPRLPALLTALKAVERLERSGAMLAERADATSIGDRLWHVVVDAHEAGIDPEQALREVVRSRVAERADTGDQP